MGCGLWLLERRFLSRSVTASLRDRGLTVSLIPRPLRLLGRYWCSSTSVTAFALSGFPTSSRAFSSKGPNPICGYVVVVAFGRVSRVSRGRRSPTLCVVSICFISASTHSFSSFGLGLAPFFSWSVGTASISGCITPLVGTDVESCSAMGALIWASLAITPNGAFASTLPRAAIGPLRECQRKTGTCKTGGSSRPIGPAVPRPNFGRGICGACISAGCFGKIPGICACLCCPAPPWPVVGPRPCVTWSR